MRVRNRRKRKIKLFAGRNRALVFAPHPDDDVLGCGGTLALALDHGLALRVIYVTDGAASHTGSPAYPPQRLRELREREALAGLHALGPGEPSVRFLRWPDGTVPMPGTSQSHSLLAAIAQEFGAGAGLLLFTPWRRDPHPDHRAVAALVAAAAPPGGTRVAEYAVWLEERGNASDAARSSDGDAVAVDISSALDRKRAAIDEHRSQLGLVISDAQTSFALPGSLLARALSGTERFIVNERSAGTLTG